MLAPPVDLETVRRLFVVDDDGTLRWSHHADVNNGVRGAVAGFVRAGRVAAEIKVKGRVLDARRLARFHATGEWPTKRKIGGEAVERVPFLELTPELVAAAITYNPETGQFVYAPGRRKAGQSTGWVNSTTGYVTVHACGHNLLAHRVAFFLMEGRWPVVMDHVNRNPADNRWSNLRECTVAQNTHNRATRAKKSTLPRGVYQPNRGSYIAQIVANGVSHYLGTFKTTGEASAAYEAARDRLHPFFARAAS